MFGVLAIDKPPRKTSRDVVNSIERIVRPIRVGHTGTLDPMATGVLLLALGHATRLVEFSHGQPKAYEADFQLGVESDSLDTDTPVRPLAEACQPTREALAAELQQWRGLVQQVPPKYSALHIGGKRAYDLARAGEEFEIPSREVEIHELELLDYAYPSFSLRIRCGTGTYIRSLGNDIARGLGSSAVMTRLVRSQIGSLDLSQCHALDSLTDREQILAALVAPGKLVEHLPHVVLDPSQAVQIRNGIPLELDHGSSSLVGYDQQGCMVAMLQRVEAAESSYRSLRVFQQAAENNQPISINKMHSPES
ncbi:tRNA pseudouridine(55) synthase TruB [Aureliella helgolandensis]|uniref:tRNA pseudouridine synthase B n=1 Tax=Aureliella helgolandensis TaxID=2527968 RepID=A0A518G633_9BACT|nr:tRNA pseudouridine(55) synthase TruB [Aureliella helgolandensis]QDV24024.1 tRNA pseudouridine synthase B [Aureliella helgolandensis]